MTYLTDARRRAPTLRQLETTAAAWLARHIVLVAAGLVVAARTLGARMVIGEEGA
jgi:hypothetical protein